jgi:AcrR family transcriptional regulator
VTGRTQDPQQPPRGRLTRAARREQLLDVTKAIVGVDGFHAISIDRVAREAGITRPIVYEHFHDLTGLLEALLSREAHRALAQLAASMPVGTVTPGNVNDVLIAMLTAYLDAIQEDPITWRLILMPPEGAPAFLRERVDHAKAEVVAQLTQLLSSGEPPPGAVASPDPQLTASSLQALADHFSRVILTDPEHYDRERILATARWALAHFTPG